MKDCREEWFEKEKKVAVTIVDVTGAAQELARGHLCGPTSAHYLAKALAAAALLGSEMSEKDETLILQMKCKGPLCGFNVECTSAGTLRGYTEKKILDDFDGLGKPKDKAVIGEAQYQVTRSVPGRVLSQGISNSLDGYLAGSLQRKACLYLEAAVSDEVEILEARGVLVEALPDSKIGSLGSKESEGALGSEALDGVFGSEGSDGVLGGEESEGVLGGDRVRGSSGVNGPLGTLLDPKVPKNLQVASRNILKQLGLEKAELRKTTPLSFACRCSPDRAVAMLAALSEEERKTLPPTVDITCHMCGKTFTVKV